MFHSIEKTGSVDTIEKRLRKTKLGTVYYKIKKKNPKWKIQFTNLTEFLVFRSVNWPLTFKYLRENKIEIQLRLVSSENGTGLVFHSRVFC